MDSHFKDGSSYIEGVPVKISKQFWPPRPVSLPHAIDTRTPAELLSIQYDFSLERSVIEFSEKRLKEIAEAKQKPKPGSANTENSAGSSSIPEESIPKTNAQHVRPWQSNTILQPQQPPDKEKTPTEEKTQKTHTKINLSDFENDTSSPFDYMELQTINDLEELNSVFQGIHSSEPISSETSVPAEDVVPTVAKSVSFPLPQNSWQTSDKISASQSEDFGNINKTGAESTYLTNLSPSQRVTSLVEEDAVSAVTKSVSYPLPQNTWQISSERITSSISQEFVANVKNFPSSSNGYAAFSSPVSKAMKDFSCDNISFSNLSQVPYISSNAGGSCEKASSLRGCKSYSDIRSISEMENVNLGIRERSHTPPTFNSGVIESVIDPLPINENHFQKPPDESSNGVIHDENSAYEELDAAAKHFVDCITEMGFPQGQVARAVKHLGVDEKKVVELLCHIQALEESGYDSSEAEAALHLHDYNRDQAKEFLDLVNQFQDLGFEKDAIKKALVQNKNDWNKTIDSLLH
ncbi:Ubiquitin-associated protein 1 like protein [Argiope bruennichi]|uniref:Ubiquitin-associated protein 1 like protein n=1 Tax=Argiope bruennichi TaxID=94029 RepID=A0A8T0G3U7_ARGBR|nr:Ubiquitin-associated protein 1 like protein [Argiope bruennichi]